MVCQQARLHKTIARAIAMKVTVVFRVRLRSVALLRLLGMNAVDMAATEAPSQTTGMIVDVIVWMVGLATSAITRSRVTWIALGTTAFLLELWHRTTAVVSAAIVSPASAVKCQ
jgi:hypothetical protein